jgi:glucokinase
VAGPVDGYRLVADIGGTHARFAVVRSGRALEKVRTLEGAAYASLEAAIRDYTSKASVPSVDAAAIAMAGPVFADGAQLTNGAWGFKITELKRQLGLAALTVLNDYEALALSLPEIDASDLIQIGGTAPKPGAVKVVLGPGTGFGGAVLVPGPPVVVLPGEPGHTSLPIRTSSEAEVAARIADSDGHTPVENAASGPGLLATYRACAEIAGARAAALSAAEVVEAARNGRDPPATRAVDHFLTWLGRTAGNVAMQLRAEGGVYIGGGIAPKMLDFMQDGRFRRAFENMGRMADLVRPIPVYVITAEAPALLGCAARLRSGA